MSESFTLRVNGKGHKVTAEPDTPLLYVLRNDLGLKSPKYGCGLEQCGACNVIIDGKKTFSCTARVKESAGKDITTLEGLGTVEAPHPIQAAFLAEQAAQCGYCLSGIAMRATALLAATPDPSEDEVRAALDAHLCRCGSHNRMVRAVLRAAREMREAAR